MESSTPQLIQLPIIAPLLIVLAIGSGCRTFPTGSEAVAQYNANPLVVAIPDGVSSTTVDQLSAVTLRNRGWSVTEQKPGSVTGHLNHRGVNATATLKQERGTVRILVDATRYNPVDSTTEPAIPLNWLQNLRKDLDRRLVRSMPGGG